MSFGKAVVTVYGKYATFSGRAVRSEYWFYTLFLVLVFAGLAIAAVGVGLAVMAEIRFNGPGTMDGPAAATLNGMLGLAFLAFVAINLIPAISVSVRRLHDLNASGWWLLPLLVLTIVQPIGVAVALAQAVWFCRPGTAGKNKFGRDPKTVVLRPYVSHN